MLQVRIKNPNSDGIGTILDKIDNKSYFKSINSSDEGISFEIAKNDPKSYLLDPYDEGSYTNLWEVWDTKTNTRLNYGPIASIEDNGSAWRVTGMGRSALLMDYYKTFKTFYASIEEVLEEVRYENLASAPTTEVLVSSLDQDNPDVAVVFPSSADETFYGLSKRTKDFVIDDSIEYIPVGKIEPPVSFATTAEYWSGVGTEDTLWLDLGTPQDIHRVKLMFPWWGGPARKNDRTYDFSINYASEGSTYLDVIDRDWGPINNAFNSTAAWGNSQVITMNGRPLSFYIGQTQSGIMNGVNAIPILQGQSGPINARYIGVHISDVHAWYGSDYDGIASHDGYAYQCDPDYRPGDDSFFGTKLGLMTYRKSGTIHSKDLSSEKLTPSNDCNASLVEFGVYKEIIENKDIQPLALQRVDNNNLAISYYREPAQSETITIVRNGLHYQKFEPGSTFSKIKVYYTGANTQRTTFFAKDCSNCYPDGFNFAIVDDENNMVYSTDDTSNAGTDWITSKQGMRYTLSRGGGAAYVTAVNAWKGKTDPLSYGGSYSYTERAGDYFSVHFRGQSFKWYATIPNDKTGANVKIEIRQKMGNGGDRHGSGTFNFWSSWTTLETGLTLPSGVTNSLVYEISYESGYLQADTVYEIKVTLNDSNYCSVDSIEGFWSASFTEYNEDSTRFKVHNPAFMRQIYDKRFSGGSMYKWNKAPSGMNLSFEGDRVVIKSARGRNHGKLSILLVNYREGATDYDTGVNDHVFIPGGDPTDGSLTVNLDTGKRGQEVPQYVIFDSDDYFNADGGLPWGKYTVKIDYITKNVQTYTTSRYETGSDNFVKRCSECSGNTGTGVTIPKYVYLDSVIVHEKIGLSVQFEDETHLDILKSVADALQVEWDVTESGLKFAPRLGSETQYALREGENVLVNYSIINDVTKVATRLLVKGSDIDGLPLSAVIEDKKTKNLFGRTITREADFRNIADYLQLIGIGRTELRKRNKPEKRINVSYLGDDLPLVQGDSFMLWTKKAGNIRVRINRQERVESSTGGTQYNLECVQWPLIT